jgi:acyl-CoA synthetase (AMP-forming)/AMP-acid ligase II
VIVLRTDAPDEVISYAQLAKRSSQMAHFLTARGIQRGDRVAIMLEPSLAFYTCLFGIMKAGAIAVPLFTLFGPDGLNLRIADCLPSLLFTNAEKIDIVSAAYQDRTLLANDALMAALDQYPDTFVTATKPTDYAMYQYTSGTTRELPEAVKHTHRSIVTLMVAALYGTGLRPGDRFMCPSSPAWGHGLWHGTLAPMALGLTIGSFAGKFNAAVLLKGLSIHRFTNISAAATHYRMMKNSGCASDYTYSFQKMSFTGEPIDSATEEFIEQTFQLLLQRPQAVGHLARLLGGDMQKIEQLLAHYEIPVSGRNVCIVGRGVTIGRHAFVGAGAVVSRDVPDFALVLGVPARQVGWMSRYGERLALPLPEGIDADTDTEFAAAAEPDPEAACPATGERYRLRGGVCMLADETSHD